MTKKICINIAALSIVLGLIFIIQTPYVDLLLAFLVIMLFMRFRVNPEFRDFFDSKKSHPKLLAISFGYAFTIVLFSDLILGPIILELTNTPLNLGPFDTIRGNPRLLMTSLIIGWFVGGLLEETIFRGFLIRIIAGFLPNKFGIFAGIMISSIIFGYLHGYQGISGQLLTGSVGIILAAIYLSHNKNIWLNIYVHGLMNSMSLSLIYFDFL